MAVTRIGAVIVPVSTFYKPFELGRFLRHVSTNGREAVVEKVAAAINSTFT